MNININNFTFYMKKEIGIIGLGFVGSAMLSSFNQHGLDIECYDKYKDGGIGTLENMLKCKMIFLALPTPFSKELKEYDKQAIYEICHKLMNHNYIGIVVIKSTVEIGTIEYLIKTYKLKIIHNPEFLSAKTAIEDFHNQTNIVIGHDNIDNNDIEYIKNFYSTYYKNTKISICTSKESEAMKIFLNSFYASKVQIFNEFYFLCHKLNVDYENVKELMLGNNWINPMHTIVKEENGLSFGGYCFPKDIMATIEMMNKNQSPNMVLKAVLEERNCIRTDNDNII